MSLQIEALSPIMWTIIIAVALVLIAAVVFTWKSSAMSTRKMVTIAMLTAVYVVLNFAGTVRLGWINISVASLPVIVGAMLYGPVGGLLPCREIGRVAGGEVIFPLFRAAFAERPQVGAKSGNMLCTRRFLHSTAAQGRSIGIQLHRCA